ncbi:MAG: hypothetical protein IKO32_06760 [Lachnospiraceae bacterium]|nr:hypothetical protein [Lachnospiraceae bacterium]
MGLNKSYFFMIFPIGLVDILLIFLCVTDFSILHLGWVIMCTALLVCHILWSNPNLFEYREDVTKAIHEWKKRKRFAEANGIPFVEQKPKASKIMTPPIGALVGVVVFVALYGSFLLALVNFAVPTGKTGYQVAIQKLKLDHPDKYSFFPDKIPENATDVEWIKQPGFAQGTSFVMLLFHADTSYLNSTLDTYCKDIEPLSVYEMPVWQGELSDMSDAELDKVEWYPIYDNGDNHRPHAWGIAVYRDTNLIVFFAQ